MCSEMKLNDLKMCRRNGVTAVTLASRLDLSSSWHGRQFLNEAVELSKVW
jgi:hypothetical protein